MKKHRKSTAKIRYIHTLKRKEWKNYYIISEKGRVLASKSPCYTLEKQYRGNYHERKTEKEEAGL